MGLTGRKCPPGLEEKSTPTRQKKVRIYNVKLSYWQRFCLALKVRVWPLTN